jgi:hypothetical protein
MTTSNLTVSEVRKMAADIGMTRLTDQHLQELLRATETARTRRASLHTDTLTPVDEPAHVFSLNAGDRR